MSDGRITRDQPRPHYKWGGPQRSPILGDSIMWTPFVVKRSNITNIRGKLVTVTPSSQRAVLQRSPIFGFISIYVYTVRRRTTKFGWQLKREGLVLGQPFVPRLIWLQGTAISGNTV